MLANPLQDTKKGISIVPPVTLGEKLLFRVFDNASPIGYARLAKIKNPRYPVGRFDLPSLNVYELKMIEISQNYRKQGVGTTLLQEVIRYCRDCNIRLLTGEIKGDARLLRRWYESNGFTVKGDNRIELLPTIRC